MRRQYARILAATLATMAGITAFAAYPDRPVRVIVPFPAGGPVDAVTRVVAERISSELKRWWWRTARAQRDKLDPKPPPIRQPMATHC
jgi:hypothetical protein